MGEERPLPCDVSPIPPPPPLPAVSGLSQLLRAGQGWPAVEAPQILAELSEQAKVVSSPSDLLALLGTISFLAKVVVDARIQLNRSALEVRSLSHGGGPPG